MSVLAVLTAASLSSLHSANLSSSGNQLVDVFAMARQNSISKNDFTAIVILTSGTTACSAYCLMELPRQVDLNSDGSVPTPTWTVLTNWKFLPTGVVFDYGDATPANDTFMTTWLNGATTPPMLPVALPATVNFQGTQVATSGAVVECYQPDGTLIWPPSQVIPSGQTLRLRLLEGTANTSGVITYTGATSSGNQVSYYDLYFIANTGNTKIGRP